MFTPTVLLLIALLAIPTRAKLISCTKESETQSSCLYIDRNITWPGSNGADWWSLDGSGAVEWWWDDETEDLPIYFYLTPVNERRDGDPRYWFNTSQWWLLDTGVMSSVGRHVFTPIKYAMPGHDIVAEHNYTAGKYRLQTATHVKLHPDSLESWTGVNCTTIEGMLRDARAGNNTQEFKPKCPTMEDQMWPAYIELKLHGPDMPQVAELQAGKRVNTSGAVAASFSWLAAAVLAVAFVAALG